MKSICLFSSYFSGNSIPYYVKFYISNIRVHFEDFVFINNVKQLDQESLNFFKSESVDLMYVENQGYDFGMWYKAIQKYDLTPYKRLALINDSCILFRNMDDEFDRINKMEADFAGMVISDRFSTHLQSFFLVYNENCISTVMKYFNLHGIIESYREVIQVYEIGLSKHLLNSGFRMMSLYNNSNRNHDMNPSFSLVANLIDEGIPMIKKKIIFRNYRWMEYYWLLTMNFNIDYRVYLKLIQNKDYKTELIDFRSVLKDGPHKTILDILLYEMIRKVINLLKYIPGSATMFNWVRDKVKYVIRGKNKT